MTLTESMPTMMMKVNPLTEQPVFDFIKTMFANDVDNEWYIAMYQGPTRVGDGILTAVDNEYVLIETPVGTDRIARENITEVEIWRVL